MDIYDLVLFSIVRVPSLQSLGLAPDEMLSKGIWLLDLQMFGMLLGGIAWGLLGDKRGRLSVLFGSIFLYSIANILNGLVQNIEQYAILRFIAGLGLAGELGAGITLVSEVLPKEKRGIGTTIVATIGVSGAIVAGTVGELFDWRTAYFIGGGLGLALLLLRVGVSESGMFQSVKSAEHIRRGAFLSLFKDASRRGRYLRSIAIGVPIWYAIGILVTFSPELAQEHGVVGEVTGARAILFTYAGLTAGDLSSGLVSQALRSRTKAVGIFLFMFVVGTLIYFLVDGMTSYQFYGLCLFLGFSVGYWAMFVTIAAEQFGTNIRATAATTIPNFVRGSVVPMTLLVQFLRPHLGLSIAAASCGVLVIAMAAFSLRKLPDTFSKDLDFLESHGS